METPASNPPAAEPDTRPDYIGTATYSPEDNKIRITAFSRLSPELYARVRAAGFIWAPRQEIFVAPMWTPAREDLAVELCGELEDEDKSLVDRAEERAERFDTYSAKRAADADRAHDAVSSITAGIPMGQPILIGHHSEKRARKDAERIENGMRKAVKMWETSKYWIERAKGALHHAKYKELPGVRARRIKKIEADKRKRDRQLIEAVEAHTFWLRPDLTPEQALRFAGGVNRSGFSMPKKEGDRPHFNHAPSECDALSNSYPNLYAPRTFAEVVARAAAVYPGRVAYLSRWIAHYENRLAYEKAMLEEQRASHLIEPPKRPTQLPLVNYRQAEIVARRSGQLQTFPQVEMTAKEFQDINKFQRGTLEVDGTHRTRFALIGREDDGSIARFPRSHSAKWCAVFLTDSKTHKKPTKDAPAPAEPAQDEQPEGLAEEIRQHARDRHIFEQENAVFLDTIAAKSLGRKYDELSEDDKIRVYGTAKMRIADAAKPADHVQTVTQGRTIWNSDGTDGPVLICAPTAKPKPEPLEDKGAKFAALKQTLKAGVKVVSAPQLFPTPPELAARMVALADIRLGHRVLEPSAGTGVLLGAMGARMFAEPGGPYVERDQLHAVEINSELARQVAVSFPLTKVHNADFLQCNGDLGMFDRIVMNPPFQNGADVLHVRHALNKLKPGGKLVAIVAGGPRQKALLEPLADFWEELPDGTFAAQGTNVRTVLLVIEKRAVR